MKADIIRIFGWVVPGICLAGAAGVLFNRHQTLAAELQALDNANRAVQLAGSERAAIEIRPTARRYAAAEQNKMEETLFLTDIRQRAAASGVSIVSWTSQTSPADPKRANARPGENVPIEPAKPGDELSDITQVISNLTLSGTYRALRTFLGGLASSDRLFTVGNVNWTRKDKGTELTVTLTRYVQPPNPNSVATDNGNKTGPVVRGISTPVPTDQTSIAKK